MRNNLHFFGSSLAVISALSLLTVQVLAAGEPGEYLKYQEPQPTTSSWLVTGGYVISLIVTFLLVLGLAYFTSRFFAHKMAGPGGFGSGKIHATLALGPNRAIYVVEIAGKFMVLGVTEHNITLLQDITSQADIDQLNAVKNSGLPSEQFDTVFHRQLVLLKQMPKKFPAVFGSDTHEINEKEHENDNRKR
ncbi:hypothetical protein SCACP_16240 [Sporomusa carbonis]|uniref:flagellar biosynthetic protein FliO n=1 Tax=Sporomusa carbonis TaxID=3076075 RepID=UPI003A63E27E